MTLKPIAPVNPTRVAQPSLLSALKASAPQFATYADIKSANGILCLLPDLGVANWTAPFIQALQELVSTTGFFPTTTLAAVHQKWSDLNSSQQSFLEGHARLVWVRRVALAIWADVHGPWSTVWKLASFPDWQLSSMLGWHPANPSQSAFEQFGDLPMQFTGMENGQNLFDHQNGGQFGMCYIWDPNPLDFFIEAQKIFALLKPISPTDACAAVVTWMRRAGWNHGFWTWYRDGLLQQSAPTTYSEEPLIGIQCSAAQCTTYHWGGCAINSTYIQRVLVSMNLPAVRHSAGEAVGDPGQVSPYGAGRFAFAHFDMDNPFHTTVTCYAAGLSMMHGDYSIDFPTRFGDPTLCWIEARAAYSLRQAAAVEKAYAVAQVIYTNPSSNVEVKNTASSIMSARLAEYREALTNCVSFLATTWGGQPSSWVSEWYLGAKNAQPLTPITLGKTSSVFWSLYNLAHFRPFTGAAQEPVLQSRFGLSVSAWPDPSAFPASTGPGGNGPPRVAHVMVRMYAMACAPVYPPGPSTDFSMTGDTLDPPLNRSWAFRMSISVFGLAVDPAYWAPIHATLIEDYYRLDLASTAGGLDARRVAFPGDQVVRYDKAVAQPPIPGDAYDIQQYFPIGYAVEIGCRQPLADLAGDPASAAAIASFAAAAIDWFNSVKPNTYQIGSSFKESIYVK